MPHRPNEKRRQRSARRDQEFQPGVECQRLRFSFRALAENYSTNAKSRHEDADHSCGCGGGCAKNKPEFPQPGGLINKRAKSRPEKKQSN
jgi:hypothetical protein